MSGCCWCCSSWCSGPAGGGGHDLVERRWFLRSCAAGGPLAVIALEAGWVATEVGRQPWIVYDVMRTAEAAADRAGLWWFVAVSVVVYAGMTAGAVVVLRSMARRWRGGAERER